MRGVPRFGFDLDGCIPDTYAAFVPVLNEMYGTNVSIDNFHAYHIENYIGLSRAQILAAFDEMIINRPDTILPYPGSIQALQEYALISEQPPVFITARPETQAEATISWLDKYLEGLNYDIEFVNGSIEKSPYAEKYGVEVFVEDSGPTALELAGAGIKTLLLDRLWNRNDPPVPGVVRILGGWQEIVENYMQKTNIEVQRGAA